MRASKFLRDFRERARRQLRTRLRTCSLSSVGFRFGFHRRQTRTPGVLATKLGNCKGGKSVASCCGNAPRTRIRGEAGEWFGVNCSGVLARNDMNWVLSLDTFRTYAGQLTL